MRILINMLCRSQNNRQEVTRQLVTLLGAVFLYSSGAVHAQDSFSPTAFSTCPSKAFLTQGKLPQTYGINLVTGDYTVMAQDHFTDQPLNAVGFNGNDRFIYAWSYEYNEPVRIHNDWEFDVLSGINITDNKFYVGDVDTERNIYYVYRRGANYGLYAIGLDPDRADYLSMSRVVDGSSLSLKIADMAVNPVDGLIYAVESNGALHQLDQSDGSSVNLGYTGQTGTFGAAYFDPDGNLYVGRNNDGGIFRIDVSSGSNAAVLFASGPAATTNDGSRCAAAPLVDDSDQNIDFGDAPDTYATSLDKNGARHGLSNSTLFLGLGVDGEANAYVYPLSDDSTGELDDDDGIQFITDIVEREYAIAMVTASGDGYLNAWIDMHQDGEFNTVDQVAINVPVEAGDQAVYLPIPDGVQPGNTWARFRLSSSLGLQPYGGAPDGEVEDMQVRVLQNIVTVTDYPSSTGWTTIAFEDNWPLLGDYDMNDLVVYMRTSTQRTSQGFTQVDVSGEVAAAGAGYHNGFGIRLPGVKLSEVDQSSVSFEINGRPVVDRPLLEANRDEAILIITNDVFDYVISGNHCEYYRTESGCGSSIQMSFELSVKFNNPVDTNLSGAFDPFLFASPGAWHGAHFVTPPGRSYEIHLKNQSPTEAFNPALFAGAGQDASLPDQGLYFLTATGMPWAIEIGDRWQYPLEYVDLSITYPGFSRFSNSNGKNSVYWYEPANAASDKLFSE